MRRAARIGDVGARRRRRLDGSRASRLVAPWPSRACGSTACSRTATSSACTAGRTSVRTATTPTSSVCCRLPRSVLPSPPRARHAVATVRLGRAVDRHSSACIRSPPPRRPAAAAGRGLGPGGPPCGRIPAASAQVGGPASRARTRGALLQGARRRAAPLTTSRVRHTRSSRLSARGRRPSLGGGPSGVSSVCSSRCSAERRTWTTNASPTCARPWPTTTTTMTRLCTAIDVRFRFRTCTGIAFLVCR